MRKPIILLAFPLFVVGCGGSSTDGSTSTGGTTNGGNDSTATTGSTGGSTNGGNGGTATTGSTGGSTNGGGSNTATTGGSDTTTGGSGSSENSTGGSTGGSTGTLVGNIAVPFVAEVTGNSATPAYATVTAQVFDGPIPPNPPTMVSQEQNGCKLIVPVPTSCDPGCASGTVCTANNQCTPRPKPQNVGEIHVNGLGDALELDPIAPAYSYSSPTLTDPYPPCQEGEDITVQSDAFSMTAKCIAPLVLTSPDPVPLISGQDPIAGSLTWTPPGKSGISRILIQVEISHHGGGEKGEIDCDVEDTGSFEIPQPLVAALIDLGRAGYPTASVRRVSIATAATQPGVTLTVSSEVVRTVDTGVVSCGGGDPPDVCPTGKTCSDDYTCK